MPNGRFLVPRDSLSRIITGDVNWSQNNSRPLHRYIGEKTDFRSWLIQAKDKQARRKVSR